MRTRKAWVYLRVSAGVVSDPTAYAIVRDRMTKNLETLTGPRGGLYRGVGPVVFDDPVEDFTTAMLTLRAHRLAVYVRPRR